MSLAVTGKIKLIGEKQTFDSGFQKVEFVLTTNDKYPQDVKFEVVKDNVDNFIKCNKVGNDVNVSFNLRGAEYKGKYYNNLVAWRISKPEAQATDIGVPAKEIETEDLPF